MECAAWGIYGNFCWWSFLPPPPPLYQYDILFSTKLFAAFLLHLPPSQECPIFLKRKKHLLHLAHFLYYLQHIRLLYSNKQSLISKDTLTNMQTYFKFGLVKILNHVRLTHLEEPKGSCQKYHSLWIQNCWVVLLCNVKYNIASPDHILCFPTFLIANIVRISNMVGEPHIHRVDNSPIFPTLIPGIGGNVGTTVTSGSKHSSKIRE